MSHLTGTSNPNAKLNTDWVSIYYFEGLSLALQFDTDPTRDGLYMVSISLSLHAHSKLMSSLYLIVYLSLILLLNLYVCTVMMMLHVMYVNLTLGGGCDQSSEYH